MYDVIIVGGGPAGLSAALVLGRCRRRVLVCDAGRPRNAAARHLHNFLTRDGIDPRELLRLGRAELEHYGVEFRAAEVTAARRTKPAGFTVTLADKRTESARKLLLATGVTDALPAVDGARDYYGRGVHLCPYGDAWEYRDQPLAAYGADGDAAAGLALMLTTWSARVTACTNGARVGVRDRRRLERNGVALRTEPLARLEGDGHHLRRLAFDAGPPLDCAAFFFNTDQAQRSPLPAMLGCAPARAGRHVATGKKQRTRVPGLFLAGDAGGDVQFVIVAAAEGATAATALNRELQDEDTGDTRRRAR